MTETKKVERWGCLQPVSEELLADGFYETVVTKIAKQRFEREHPDYEILEVEPVQVHRPQPPFDWTTYKDDDGVEHIYKTPPIVRVMLKVTKQ